MEFSSNLPIYIQIMNMIKAKIAAGELDGGDRLMSVREYSKELKVNPNTIQRVYQELEREGIIFTQRGMGSFVTKDMETIKNLKNNMAQDVIGRFFTEMKNMGFTAMEIRDMVVNYLDREDKK